MTLNYLKDTNKSTCNKFNLFILVDVTNHITFAIVYKLQVNFKITALLDHFQGK